MFCQNDIQWLKISEISDSCQEENLHFDQIQGYTCNGSVAMIKINGGLEN